MSEVTGKIKVINETKTFGTSEFRKRECRVTTNEQYPQILPIEFVQDKCDLLDNFKVGDDVKISINLRGNEWTNPDGIVKCFPSIQGWRIEKLEQQENVQQSTTEQEISTQESNDVGDGMPF